MNKIKNNNNRLRLLVDLDGVCADFYGRIAEWYNRDFDDNIDPVEGVVSWSMVKCFPKATEAELKSYFEVPGFWSGLDPIPGCKEVMERLHNKGHDILIVTSIPSYATRACYEKGEWVNEHLPFISHHNMIGAKRKDVVQGDILFDDGPHNLRNFPGITCAMDTLYNKKVYANFRVNTWLGFEKVVEGLSQ